MKLHYLEKISSTNTYSKENIDILEDRTIVYTSKQTSGRGRFNRSWIYLGEDNLYFSIILKPSNKFQKVYANLTQYTALILAKTLEKYNVIPKIKWPNDILIEDKKISGILAESVSQAENLKGLIIGLGVNLNTEEKLLAKIDKKVTALNLETNSKINKTIFLNDFLNLFFQDYEIFLKNGFESILQEYSDKTNFLGQEITIQNSTEKITGIAERLTKDGSLVLNGKEFFTGDIL